MDHLRTSKERQDFWYSDHRIPRFVPVSPAESVADLVTSASAPSYDVVRSLPYGWIEDPPVGMNIRQILETHGFLVVSGVLTDDECKTALMHAWDWITGATCVEQAHEEGLDETQSDRLHESLQAANYDSILMSRHFPKSAEGGMLPFYGSGHSSFAWNIRSNPKIKKIFETFYGTHDLISSLDGIVLWHNKMRRTDSGWFHLDQNPLEKPDFEALQGLVNLLPVPPDIGGNVIVAQSNRIFPNHYLKTAYYQDRLRELNGDDWLEVVHDDDDAFKGREVICCLLQPGDMLLWDSRTIHCSYPGSMTVKENTGSATESDTMSDSMHHHGLTRAASLVSMMPSNRATNDVLEERRKAVDSGRTLTHWVNKATPLGHEREDEVAREFDLVQRMKSLKGQRLLLDFEDLSPEQRNLVLGNEQGAS